MNKRQIKKQIKKILNQKVKENIIDNYEIINNKIIDLKSGNYTNTLFLEEKTCKKNIIFLKHYLRR